VYDCALDDFTHGFQLFLDECYNPILFQVGTKWNTLLKIHIIYLNDQRVSCCVNYGVDSPEQALKQVRVCNRPNATKILEDQCPPDSKGGSLREYVIPNWVKKWKAVEKQPGKRLKLESNEYIVRCMCVDLHYVLAKYPAPFVNADLCRKAVDSI